MTIRVDDSDKAELYHDSGCEHWRRLRAHDFLEHLPACLRGVHFLLKLRAAAIMQTGPDSARDNEQRHRGPQGPNAARALRDTVPHGQDQGRGDAYERHELQPVLVVLNQVQLGTGADEPEDEDGKKRPANWRNGTGSHGNGQYTSPAVAKS